MINGDLTHGLRGEISLSLRPQKVGYRILKRISGTHFLLILTQRNPIIPRWSKGTNLSLAFVYYTFL